MYIYIDRYRYCKWDRVVFVSCKWLDVSAYAFLRDFVAYVAGHKNTQKSPIGVYIGSVHFKPWFSSMTPYSPGNQNWMQKCVESKLLMGLDFAG